METPDQLPFIRDFSFHGLKRVTLFRHVMAGMPVAKGKNREQDSDPLLDVPRITLCLSGRILFGGIIYVFVDVNIQELIDSSIISDMTSIEKDL